MVCSVRMLRDGQYCVTTDDLFTLYACTLQTMGVKNCIVFSVEKKVYGMGPGFYPTIHRDLGAGALTCQCAVFSAFCSCTGA